MTRVYLPFGSFGKYSNWWELVGVSGGWWELAEVGRSWQEIMGLSGKKWELVGDRGIHRNYGRYTLSGAYIG